MKYFTPDFLQFFKDLAANNNRDWFHENKSRYEQSVKKPFEIFVQELIKSVQKHDKTIQIKPSEAIFRINRDIRFSKEKSPYKLNASAIVADGGRKSQGASGLYVECGPEKLAIGGGIYAPEKEQLQSIREYIAKKPQQLMELVAEKSFQKHWGEIQGEKNKIIAPEFRKAAEKCPLIYNKQYYTWAELDPKIITSDKLLPTIMEYYSTMRPLMQFLQKAIA
jgi:uncharacterized protein (TIGR02453 family)